MNTKTKIALLVVVVMGLSAIPLRVQYRHILAANAEQARLAKKHVSLQAAVDRLQLAVQNPQDSQLRAQVLSRTVAEGGEYVLAKKESIEYAISWQALDYDIKSGHSDFKLSDQAVGLLSLTPDEATQVQNILMELKERIHAYQRSAIHEITAEQLHTPNPFNENFLTVHRDKDLFDLSEVTGTLTFYEILPMGDDQRKALRQWVSNSLSSIIGSDRAEVLGANLVVRQPFKSIYYDQEDEESTLFAFWDHVSADGQETETEWEVDGGDNGVRSGISAEAVPSQWAYLFQEITDDPTNRRKIAR